MKFIFKFFELIFLFYRWLFNILFIHFKKKKIIKNIERNNELQKNIIRYNPIKIENLIEKSNPIDSHIISGGTSDNRSKLGASITACSLSQGIPTIILHEGNLTLQNYVKNATNSFRDKVIITGSTPIYDPFYNRSDKEICNLIVNSSSSNTLINATGQQYILGIIDFIRSKNISPYYEMLVSCPHNQLIDKIDDAEKKGYLSNQRAMMIKSQLIQGQNERANVQAFFSQLSSSQGAGILSNRGDKNSAVNIRTAVSHDGLIMIDIGSSTNEILLNLIVNEIKEVLTFGKKIMLILDGININSNDLLSKVIKSLSSKCLTTFLSENIYSTLGANDKLFHTFVGNASKCIVFSHMDSIACNKWSEIFGYYDAEKISQTIGGNQYFGLQDSFTTSFNREFILKPEEISRMSTNEIYILDKSTKGKLIYTTLL